MSFDNNDAFLEYRVVFSETRSGGSSIQFAEIELPGYLLDAWPTTSTTQATATTSEATTTTTSTTSDATTTTTSTSHKGPSNSPSKAPTDVSWTFTCLWCSNLVFINYARMTLIFPSFSRNPRILLQPSPLGIRLWVSFCYTNHLKCYSSCSLRHSYSGRAH